MTKVPWADKRTNTENMQMLEKRAKIHGNHKEMAGEILWVRDKDSRTGELGSDWQGGRKKTERKREI